MNLTQPQEKGVHLVELAIGLPLFIGLLFAMFDTARISLANSAVKVAVYQSARRAAGLKRPVTNTDFASIFGALQEAPAASLNSSDLFYNPGTPLSPTASTYYATKGPDPIHRVEAISLAYAYRIIEQSFGNVQFPCTDEANCVHCNSMRNFDPAYLSTFCKENCTPGTTTAIYKVRYLGIRCTINVPIMSTSVFLGWLPEFLPLTATAYVSMENHALVVFNPNPPIP